jgi:hypothetical protein
MIMIVDRSFKVLKMCRHEEEFCNYIPLAIRKGLYLG